MKRIFKLGMIIFWMVIIFYYSNQNGAESSKQSLFIVRVFPCLDSFLGEIAHIIIRKGAHFFEYFILASLLFNYLKDFIKKPKYYLYTLSVSIIYACSDEIHQYFVPMRHSDYIDVLIDTLGAMTFLLLVYLLSLRKKVKTLIF